MKADAYGWREVCSGISLMPLRRHVDGRGWFLKVALASQLGPAGARFGEIYLVSATTGNLRGGHFHRKTWEWFLVVQGTAEFFYRPENEMEWRTMTLTENEPYLVEVRSGAAHGFRAVGSSPLVLLAYSNKAYDHDDPDTIPVDVPKA
jgi:dTDP-4-dehydrorhamnose 3,5-epimerase